MPASRWLRGRGRYAAFLWMQVGDPEAAAEAAEEVGS